MIYELYIPFMLKREDEPNLRQSGLWLGIPADSEQEAIHKLARMITRADVEWQGVRNEGAAPKLDS